jgi:hypothetical protein
MLLKLRALLRSSMRRAGLNNKVGLMTKIEVAAPGTNAPIWCVAANVRDSIPFSHGAVETRRGTRKFHAGAKVYLASAFWGTGAERVTVVGHYRGKGYITASIKTRYLTNWRAELVYSPTVFARLKEIPAWHSLQWDGSTESKARAEQMAEQFGTFSDELHRDRLAKRQSSQEEQD